MINIEDLFDKNYEYNSIAQNAKNIILNKINIPLYMGEESIEDAKVYAESRIREFEHNTLLRLLTIGRVISNKFDSNDITSLEFMKVYPENIGENSTNNSMQFGIANPNIADKYKNKYNLMYNDEWPEDIITILPNHEIIGTLFYGITPLEADLYTDCSYIRDIGSHDKIAFGYDFCNNSLLAQELFTVVFKNGPISILRIKE